MPNLLIKKSIAEIRKDISGRQGLAKALGPMQLTFLGMGGIIGAGIFVLTGIAAAQYAGPAVSLSFIIAALACTFAGLCYAEFASMIPVAGSAYTYAYATLGELFAWIIGWDLVLEYALGATAVSIGWSGYFVSLLRSMGINFPAALASAPFIFDPHVQRFAVTGSIINLPAALIILIVTAILAYGIRESAVFNTVIVIIKITVVLMFIAAGIFFIKTSLWSPFVPDNAGNWGRFGWSGVLRGAGIIFFAYIGFDAVSTAAQEAKNPQKDMPVAMLASLGICTVLYILVSLVMTGVVRYTDLNVPAPVAVAIDAMNLPWLQWPVKLGAIAGLTSVLLVQLLGQSRIFYAMSADGLLPRRASAIHPRHRTPWIVTLLTGGTVALSAALLPIEIVGELVSIGTLFAFSMVSVSVLVLRRTQPHVPRPFRVPLYPAIPVLGAGTCAYLMLNLPLDTWIRLAVWMAIGLAVYFGYGIRHSRMRKNSDR